MRKHNPEIRRQQSNNKATKKEETRKSLLFSSVGTGFVPVMEPDQSRTMFSAAASTAGAASSAAATTGAAASATASEALSRAT